MAWFVIALFYIGMPLVVYWLAKTFNKPWYPKYFASVLALILFGTLSSCATIRYMMEQASPNYGEPGPPSR